MWPVTIRDSGLRAQRDRAPVPAHSGGMRMAEWLGHQDSNLDWLSQSPPTLYLCGSASRPAPICFQMGTRHKSRPARIEATSAGIGVRFQKLNWSANGSEAMPIPTSASATPIQSTLTVLPKRRCSKFASKPARNQENALATELDPVDYRLEQISSSGIGQSALPQALCFSQ